MTVWVASRFAPTYQGGLGAYTRQVIHGVQRKTHADLTVVCAAAEMGSLPAAQGYDAFPVVELEMTRFGRVSKPLWNRCASKSSLHGFLETILHRAWQEPEINKPNVIHYVGTGWDFFGFAMAKVARNYRARFVITPALHPGAWGNDRIDARLYQQADAIVCFTNSESQFLQKLGVAAEKISVCPLPPTCRADGDGSRFRKKVGLNSHRCVLFVGRRDEGKGYPALLRAWPLVLRAVPDAVLILAGAGGDEYRELFAGIPDHNICDLGIPNEIEKADAIAACDVFCLPSAHESFGIVYVDAWSYRKSVVCGTAPACREFISDGKTGLWANQVPEQLAEKLITLLENQAMRETMGEAGKREQVLRFNEDTFNRTHFDALGLSNSEAG
ncbi:MAG: glycosyltransferase family 4 protein [Verrucomicrobia bacterium]|nr:glycosyltransferase family 4 protein [Verrucomicrobiota bacterium]